MLSINTNLPSLIAQNSLKKSTLKLNQAVERMSTGYKINHAKDNAANYSISTNMTTKIGAYQVAEDNCAMGLDFITTADESLSLISDKLTRLRALAEQAANGTYGNQSLKAINAESNALVDEIERSYKNTEYNGIKLFGDINSDFIEKVNQRDTSLMTTLASIDENSVIASGTYSISSAEELAKLATMVNNGKVTGGEFVLANDIDLSKYSSGEGWTPIGNTTNIFKGVFDGNGHVISNLYINRPTENYIGLFGYSGSSGEIKNIGIINAIVTGHNNVGGIAGGAITITNCYTTGIVTGNSIVGGIAGNTRTLSNSYSTSSVKGDTTVGGLLGATESVVRNCYATGNVTGNLGVGGLLGGADTGSISNCYSNGYIIGKDGLVGGLIGAPAADSITNSYYNSETSVQSDTGNGDGITTAEIQALIANGTLWNPKQNENQVLTTFQVGINSSVNSQITLDTAFSINISSLRSIGLSNADYLSQIDTLINTVSAKQTEYGAVQNRLESALDEISTQYENLVSSRSTLRDADIAQVSSEYIRQQILQQASATLLSTANQTPALALQLL